MLGRVRGREEVTVWGDVTRSVCMCVCGGLAVGRAGRTATAGFSAAQGVSRSKSGCVRPLGYCGTLTMVSIDISVSFECFKLYSFVGFLCVCVYIYMLIGLHV